METKIMRGEEAVRRGAEIIAAGGVVVFPTETVYGLGADAFNASAVAEIYRAKGRPADNPLIVHVADAADIAPLTREIPAAARAVIERFMPGAITVILPKSDAVPDAVTAGLPGVGIRMPAHPTARAFIRACAVPIAAPSANTSSRISPTTAAHVFEDLAGRVPLIIDGGACDVGIESTIVDFTTDVPTILRPGSVTSDMLADTLGSVKTFRGEVVFAKAPGMKYKHYAPACDAFMCADRARAFAAYDSRRAAGGRPVIVAGSDWARYADGRDVVDVGGNAESVMRNIYNALHEAEKRADLIICADFGTEGRYASVMNRVGKACAGRRL